MSTIVFLEGISKSGKTSWYERNEALLHRHYRYGVKYYHPHQSEEGQRLKQSWIENESSKPTPVPHNCRVIDSVRIREEHHSKYLLNVKQIAWQYVGLHLVMQEQIFHDVKKYGADLVVLDRTLLTTLSINFNSCFPAMGIESDIFPHPLHHLMIEYFRRFEEVFNNRKMLFFDCGKPAERYRTMYNQGINDSYRKNIMKMPHDARIFEHITVFADETIYEVDESLRMRLNLHPEVE